MRKLAKTYKLLAIIVVLALIVQGLIMSLNSINSRESGEPVNEVQGSNDSLIAADISNMTGVLSERILQMKASGQSWNDILDTLKDDKSGGNHAAKEQRSLQLLKAGLGEEAVARLLSEGYAEQDIADAKLLAERAVSQMEELTDETAPTAPAIPSVDPSGSLAADDEESFQTELRVVMERFELETAVRLMLALRTDFGTYELVLDEYLYALQLDLNLEDYLKDMEQYMLDKERRSAEKVGQPVISLYAIEQRLLEHIQNENAASREEAISQVSDPAFSEPSSSETNPLPEPPLPTVNDEKPVNPAKAVEDELSELNPNLSISN